MLITIEQKHETRSWYTQKEIQMVKNICVKHIYANHSFRDVVKDLQKHGIMVEYGDKHKYQNNKLISQAFRVPTWTKLKEMVTEDIFDIHGIIPVKDGYKFRGETYPDVQTLLSIKLSEIPLYNGINWNKILGGE